MINLSPAHADYIRDGRPLVPAHVAFPGDDFMPAGWCGGCETCANYPAGIVCFACSYPIDNVTDLPYPGDPTNWPCPVEQARLSEQFGVGDTAVVTFAVCYRCGGVKVTARDRFVQLDLIDSEAPQ